ncbi:MAG: sulfotransferase [Flavobacteriales bacterium]
MKPLEIIRGFAAYYRQLKSQRNITRLQGRDARLLFEEVCAEAQPCFVLSTGRSGTMMLTRLLQLCDTLEVQHQPAPELLWMSKYAYKHYQKRADELKMAFVAARYEMIRDAFLNKRQYVETNNRITFFAYQIAALFPAARFIHLVRRPEPFVKSGLARAWYTGSHLHDEGRITPFDSSVEWESFSRIQKIAWLWNETNSFIEDFKEKTKAEVLSLSSESLFSKPETTCNIMDFLGAEPPPRKQLIKLLSKPLNAGRQNRDLTVDEQDIIARLTPLADKYYL